MTNIVYYYCKLYSSAFRQLTAEKEIIKHNNTQHLHTSYVYTTDKQVKQLDDILSAYMAPTSSKNIDLNTKTACHTSPFFLRFLPGFRLLYFVSCCSHFSVSFLRRLTVK